MPSLKGEWIEDLFTLVAFLLSLLIPPLTLLSHTEGIDLMILS